MDNAEVRRGYMTAPSCWVSARRRVKEPKCRLLGGANHRRIDCVEGGRSVRCASVLVARGVEAKHTRARPIAFAESIRYVQSYRTELEVRRDVLPQIQTPEDGYKTCKKFTYW